MRERVKQLAGKRFNQPKIGYVPIGNYQTDKPKVCETPRHRGRELPAFAVMAVCDERGRNVVQMVCAECWKIFDTDMGSPNWNLMKAER